MNKKNSIKKVVRNQFTKKIVLAVVGFSVLLLLSEAIYFYQNDKDFKAKIYANLAKISVNLTKTELAYNFINRVAKIRVNQLSNQYPDLFDASKVVFPALPENEELLKEYHQVFLSNNYEKSVNSNPSLAKLYYTLGLIAYRKNIPELTKNLWKTSAHLGSEWSYFYIELANFYMIKEENQQAKDTLDNCLKFNYPKIHCQLFIDTNLETGISEEVGFLEETINKKI